MAASKESINRLYNELFGRNAEEKGIAYWQGTGLTGEKLRDNLIYASGQAEEGKRQDYNSYLARQAQLARGVEPAGYGPSVSQEALIAMQEEIAALRELLNTQSTRVGTPATVPVGTPSGNVPDQVTQQVADPTGTYSSGSLGVTGLEQTNPYLAPVGDPSMPGYVPPTPEMLDAYRFQQYYNQGAVTPVDQGIGSLSYFGIPPSQIQATLSGF
tara:strand:- start:314 stop:955 length:642 start_codon:yes stop_codon:yes gene_type:complete